MFQTLNETEDPNDLKGKEFLGTVVDNNDTEHLERLRVTIPNLFEGDVDNLPWVSRGGNRTIARGPDKFGCFGLIPRIGVQVIITFKDGNPLFPEWTTCPNQKDETPEEALTNYLYRYGRKDPRGNVFFIDTLPEAAVQAYIKLTCGVEISVSDTGKVNIYVKDDVTAQLDKRLTMTVNGNIQLTAKANVTANITGNLTATVGQNTSLTTQGNTNVTTAGNTSIVSNANTSITSTGNTTMVSTGLTSIAATAGLAISSSGNGNVESDGNLNIHSKGTVTIRGDTLVQLNP